VIRLWELLVAFGSLLLPVLPTGGHGFLHHAVCYGREAERI
jgi:hypothetical protein